MMFAGWKRLVIAMLLLASSHAALAADQCPALSQRQSDAQVAIRIAAVACDEHLRWNRPFIDADGRLASLTAYEAEDNGLKDGGAPWRKVAYYWQSSGLLGPLAFKSGASDCNHAAMNASYPGLGCRSFVVDNPWSAAFISWVMQRAGVPGFTSSPNHYEYVRAARSNPTGSPYLFTEPMAATLAVGDMLCYVRSNRVYGFDGLVKAIDGGATSLPMHCDAIVAIDGGKAYTIGGNVQQAVGMRILNVNANGQLWGLPRRSDGDVVCSPDTAGYCNFNRQDWAALLKLKPQDELAKLGPVTPPALLPAPPVPQTCCVNCVVGSGVPRCPAQGDSQPVQPQNLLQGSQ
ncbi:MAG: DUF2272 domain-containing protein [Thermomonas sp.]|uniref:DUF2272 domain-containing protein n=1 Tax=Thermomonas sp. TaxID=1971895 RepID=UPI0039E5D06A